MTDEQLGRAWCERNGRKPSVCDDGMASWSVSLFGDLFYTGKNPAILPKILYATVQDFGNHEDFPSEADAYAAVGAALRQVVRFAQDVWDLQEEVGGE